MRPALVLVASADLLPPDLFTRHPPGAHVELARLDDLLRVGDGALAFVARLRLVRAPASAPASAPARSPVAYAAARELPRIARWSDLHLRYVDGLTLLARAERRYARVTHIDLGMASKKNREPTIAFKILSAICQGDGNLRWRPFGELDAVSRQISYLRAKMARAFGIDDNPFEDAMRDGTWKPKFRAWSWLPGDDEARGIDP